MCQEKTSQRLANLSGSLTNLNILEPSVFHSFIVFDSHERNISFWEKILVFVLPEHNFFELSIQILNWWNSNFGKIGRFQFLCMKLIVMQPISLSTPAEKEYTVYLILLFPHLICLSTAYGLCTTIDLFTLKSVPSKAMVPCMTVTHSIQQIFWSHSLLILFLIAFSSTWYEDICSFEAIRTTCSHLSFFHSHIFLIVASPPVSPVFLSQFFVFFQSGSTFVVPFLPISSH